ncbi:MAG TPA: hypothetical protein ENI88_12620 [Desulfobulbus sp.]|nr:hypothetical protein [Desulfobulbus sp.]
MIVKKEVCADRFDDPAAENRPIQCPEDCHACCRLGVVLDLTSVESLMIFLLNRDVIAIIDEYTRLHDATGYCPFMIMDKCIINDFKPSACQMYMPFEYKKKPMCYYLAGNGLASRNDLSLEYTLNSSSYDIHGFMMIIQNDIDQYLSRSFFKNIYDGTQWWKEHYRTLPVDTRICLESILCADSIGLQLTHDFKFEEALAAGHQAYTDKVARRPGMPAAGAAQTET